jgi:hypothetical protein
MASFQAQEKREMQQLNRQSSLQSSASQQAAAYGAQQSQMFGQAVGAVGSFAAQGGFRKKATTSTYGTDLIENQNPMIEQVTNISGIDTPMGGGVYGATGLEGLRGMSPARRFTAEEIQQYTNNPELFNLQG